MYALKSPPGAIETPDTAISAHAVEMLSDEVFASLPCAESSVALCADRISEALRTGDPTAIKTWLLRETHAASQKEIFGVLDATCNAVAASARDLKQLRLMSALLEQVRAEVSDDMHEMHSSRRIDNMKAPDIQKVASGLLSMIEAYDADTAVHLRATATLARRIAETMHLSPKMIADIELAALMHDIGKIRVPVEVLTKPGSLTAHEWGLMKQHPQTGFEMLERVAELQHVAHIVKSHHERIDGAGYPDRLIGDEIPLEARVVAVADAFHAMTVKRSYRDKMGPKAALDELYANRNTQFDAVVVAALCENFGYVPREIVKTSPATIQALRRGA